MRSTYCVAALLVILMLFGCGCESLQAPTERQSLYASTQLYSSTMTSLRVAHDIGKLSEEQIETVNEYEPLVWSALNEWREREAAGLPAEDSIESFSANLDRLRDILARSQQQNE